MQLPPSAVRAKRAHLQFVEKSQKMNPLVGTTAGQTREWPGRVTARNTFLDT